MPQVGESVCGIQHLKDRRMYIVFVPPHLQVRLGHRSAQGGCRLGWAGLAGWLAASNGWRMAFGRGDLAYRTY